jgi:hypothetical protein
MALTRKTISIVAPRYEEDNVEPCYEAMRTLYECTLSSDDYEHIVCDNAFTDATPALPYRSDQVMRLQADISCLPTTRGRNLPVLLEEGLAGMAKVSVAGEPTT